MKKYILLTTVLLISLMACKNGKRSESEFLLQEGDLLFQDLDCGDLCTAIETVTSSVNKAKFSHIGMIVKNSENKLVVIEATTPEVKFTQIEDFIYRNKDSIGKPKVMVARLKKDYNSLISKACAEVISHIGKPYDGIYIMDTSSFYCSELIYQAFKIANTEQAFFMLAPMTFNDPETGEPFPAWTNYYEELGVDIPEGKPGINPGGISLSDKIDIVHWYYQP